MVEHVREHLVELLLGGAALEAELAELLPDPWAANEHLQRRDHLLQLLVEVADLLAVVVPGLVSLRELLVANLHPAARLGQPAEVLQVQE